MTLDSNNDVFKGLTHIQIENVVTKTKDFINHLDEYALGELFKGEEQDVDNVLSEIFLEISNIYYRRQDKILTTSSPTYIDSLHENFDLFLRRRNFNYFVANTLPSFDISLFHLEWGQLIQYYQNLGIEAARFHSKSYVFCYAYPLWKLFSYQRGDKSLHSKLSQHGLLVTNEFSLAKDFLKQIVGEIENNAYLREHLYPDNTAGLGAVAIDCKNGATLKIKGSGSQIRGIHTGWCVLDDIMSDSCLYSEDARLEIIEFVNSVILNVVDKGGQTIVSGTPFHSKDLFGYLKTTPGWRVFEYPAIFPDGSLLWPEKYDFGDFRKKREQQGPIIFSREILVTPITDGTSIFPYFILEKAFVGMSDYTVVQNRYSHRIKFKKIAIGADFAISANIGADYSVFTVVGIDDFGIIWVLARIRVQGASYNEQIALLKKLNYDFTPDVIMCEENGFQLIFLQLLKDHGVDKAVGHNTGTNKYDLKSGLPGLAVLFEQGKIKMPRGNKESLDVTDSICSELNGMTFANSKLENIHGHDDQAMSLWLGVKGLHYINENIILDFINY